MNNLQIAQIFTEIANIMEIQGEDFFRFNSYNKAAQTIEHYSEEMKDVYGKGKRMALQQIPGIGPAISEKIEELITTGELDYHKKLKKSIPAGLLEMLNLRGVGPKKVKLFFQELKIHNIEQLEKACKEGKIAELPKMGEKSQAEILNSIQDYRSFSMDRHFLHDALQQAEEYIKYLKDMPQIKRIEYAGSLRRRAETIGDVDLLVESTEPHKVMKFFIAYPEVASTLADGDTKSSVVLKSGLQVDLRVVPKESFGAALHYFTGSKAHNIRIRDKAKKMGLKINEYGVFKGEKQIAGKTEEEIFASVGWPYIIPQMREDRGEVEWVEAGRALPKTVELKDLIADLHCHSNWSDGSEPIETVAENYRKAGFKYMALTDHSKGQTVANGLDEKRFKEQFKVIDALNKSYKDFRILKGAEVDILKNGDLDLADDLLEMLDIVVISIHSYFNLPEAEQTERLIKAISHPSAKIVGHMSGRLINQRKPCDLNMERVFEACVEYNTAIEINSSPYRLDLQDKYIKRAKEAGVKFTIDSDSHHSSQREYLKFGVDMAKKGWLTKHDVLNTKPFTPSIFSKDRA